ncbi:MAG: hypothetical protein R6T92_01485, partial [Desulfosalsimonadaceae bacterium]
MGIAIWILGIFPSLGYSTFLPTELVEAFKSTLEETTEADLLLHVVDAAHDDVDAQIAAAETKTKYGIYKWKRIRAFFPMDIPMGWFCCCHSYSVWRMV